MADLLHPDPDLERRHSAPRSKSNELRNAIPHAKCNQVDGFDYIIVNEAQDNIDRETESGAWVLLFHKLISH